MDRGTFLPTGWVPPPGLSADGWLSTGHTPLMLEVATAWYWGDWWLAAENSRQLPDDWYGPDRRTLDNYASICRRFAVHTRREDVPFKHHAEVASLPAAEREALLGWCEQHRALIPELREERRRRAAALLPPKPKPTPPPAPTPAAPPPKPPAGRGRGEAPPAVVLPRDPPRPEIDVPVTIYIPEHLHLWAVEAAEADDKSLAYWIIGLIAQAKSGDRR